MTIDIKTAGAVSVAEILARTGDEVVVGQPIAVLTRDGSQPPDDTTNLPDLPATIEVAKR